MIEVIYKYNFQEKYVIIENRIREIANLHGYRLHANADNSISYKRCDKSYPLNIDVMQMIKQDNMRDLECIMYLNCANKSHKCDFL